LLSEIKSKKSENVHKFCIYITLQLHYKLHNLHGCWISHAGVSGGQMNSPMSIARLDTGRLNCVTSLYASSRISMTLFRSANNGARGNAATNMVIKPYWITEMQQNHTKCIHTINKHFFVIHVINCRAKTMIYQEIEANSTQDLTQLGVFQQ